jgi:hypothetical protein
MVRQLVPLLFLVTALTFAVRAQSPHDQQTNAELADKVIAELKAGQFDALEEQYKRFAAGELQPNGTPKSVIYFWAFERASSEQETLEKSEAIVGKIKDWLVQFPDSVAATLAYDKSLLGECDLIAKEVNKRGLPAADPKSLEGLGKRGDEITRFMGSRPPEVMERLVSEPQLYVVTMYSFSLVGGNYAKFEALTADLQTADPYYSPFYSQAIIWLAKRRLEGVVVPRPEVWLMDQLKPTALDSEQDVKRRSETYAAVISEINPATYKIDVGLVDWQFLKTGLENLIKDFGPNTDWPTRLLVDARVAGDKETAREALKFIQGNYSPEIVVDPDVFQDLTKWAEGAEGY